MKKYILALIPMFALNSCSGFNPYTYDDTGFIKYEGLCSVNQHIETIHIDWMCGNVQIIDGEEFTIYEERISDVYYPLYYKTIRQDLYKDRFDLYIYFAPTRSKQSSIGDLEKKLVITIPYDIFAVNLVTSSAEYSIKTVKEIDCFDITSASGSGEIDVETTSGIRYYATSGDLNFTCRSSEEISSDAINALEFNTMSGDVTVNLDGKRGYNLDFSSMTGECNQEFTDGSDKDLKKFNMKFMSISGDLNINKIV